jgi:hypothetical protein
MRRNADRVGDREYMTADEHIRETYAHFGLAVYLAQVLEHGIVNAMVAARLPLRPSFTVADVDALMDKEFENTLGKLIRNLKADVQIPPRLEDLLTTALRKRNWLCHDCWREHAVNFMKWEGRERMMAEFQEAQRLMKEADQALESLVRPMQVASGITQSMVDDIYAEMCRENQIIV